MVNTGVFGHGHCSLANKDLTILSVKANYYQGEFHMSKSMVFVGVYEVYGVFEHLSADGDPILLKLFANQYDAQAYRAHLINKEDLDPDMISVEEVSVDELAKDAPTF